MLRAVEINHGARRACDQTRKAGAPRILRQKIGISVFQRDQALCGEAAIGKQRGGIGPPGMGVDRITGYLAGWGPIRSKLCDIRRLMPGSARAQLAVKSAIGALHAKI
jgi:hypothetical protein